jgi:hypothetical protein
LPKVGNSIISTNSNNLSDTEYSSETDTDAEEYILTELEYNIYKNNTKVAARIVKKSGSKVQEFKAGWLVTLAIPSKLRLYTESKQLLCRVVKVVKNQYTLITAKGPIAGGHSASELNPVKASNKSLIPESWPENTKKLTLTKAVQLSNNRGTIAQAQKAAQLQGRKRKQAMVQHEPEEIQEEDKPVRRSGRKVQKRVLE